MRKSVRLLPVALRTTSQLACIRASELQGWLAPLGCGHDRVPHFIGTSQPWLREFLSRSFDGEDDTTDELLTEKLRKIAHIVQLQRDLQHESELRDSMPHEKLFKLILGRGAARNELEAEELVTALQRSGFIILHNKQVYLKPSELVDHHLPDFANAKDLKAQLEEINKKLEAFDKVNDLAEKKAWRLLYLGSLCLLVQLAIFLRFTYYEFSWDVMEPIGYLISLFYTLLGSWFFIYTKGHPFDLQPVKEWYAKTYQAEHLGVKAPDVERYKALSEARERYKKRMQFFERLSLEGGQSTRTTST